MRKVYALICLAGALGVGSVQAAYDGTLNLGATRLWGNGPGGEFTVTVTSGLGSITAGSFQSFCIETSEFINFGGNYNANINSAAVKGSQPVSDPLSVGTAWLYYQFRLGTLAGYTYSGAGRNASADALQDAIWWLEGEGGARNAFINTAEDALYGGHVGKDAQLMGDAAKGLYNVVALNLYAGDTLAQDQLAIPEASTWFAGAMMVLPIGLMGIRSLRKDRKA